MPITPVIGVRVSWLSLARNALLARELRGPHPALPAKGLPAACVSDVGKGGHGELDRSGFVVDRDGSHVHANSCSVGSPDYKIVGRGTFADLGVPHMAKDMRKPVR